MADTTAKHASHNPALLFGAWLLVGAPLLWGVVMTIIKATALFK